MSAITAVCPPSCAAPFLQRPLSPKVPIAIAWLLTLAAFLGTGFSPILSGGLFDPDDYMRILQVTRWLDGGGWRDFVEPRIDPPVGLALHWSRLVDLPLAAVIVVTQGLVGRAQAIILAATIVPAGLLASFFAAVMWMARPLVRRDDLPYVMLAVAAPFKLVYEFAPGRVDHHGWQLLLTALALGALLRIAIRPDAGRAPLVAGIGGALALWIGGEALPWLAALNLSLALAWMLTGKPVPATALRYAATLALCAVALLFLTVASAERARPVCDAFGTAYAGLAVATAMFWAVLAVIGNRGGTAMRRAGCVAAAGLVSGAAYLALFPECRFGPYGQVDPQLAAAWLSNVAEAMPLQAVFAGGFWLIPVFVAGPLFALIAAMVKLRAAAGPERRAWLAIAVFLSAAILLGFVQIRVLLFADLFAAVPLIVLAGSVARRLGGRRATAWRAAAIGLVLPALTLLCPGLALQHAAAAIDAGVTTGPACDLAATAATLDGSRLGDRRRLIAAPIDHGPELLFRTPHAVLGAPYHRNAAGNLAILAFFGATDAATAEALARSRGIDLVLICDSDTSSGHDLLSRLKEGMAPPWLDPVALPAAARAHLYAVRPSGTEAAP